MPFQIPVVHTLQLLRWGAALTLLLVCAPAASRAAEAAQPQPEIQLTLQDVLQRTLEHNESVQMRLLEMEISRRSLQAEKGIFEPQVVGSVERVDTHRPNNAQQQRSQFTSEFRERNMIYNGGLEFLTPIGTRLRTGLALRRLQNNLQGGSLFSPSTNGLGKEYEAFVGASLTQPLLKGFGLNATMARIRMAAVASDMAFQEYRRQLMLVVARTESAYWDLYLTQEQERLSEESVHTAESILTDNRNRAQVGRAPELEVLQAEAGLALRLARQNDARLRRIEGVSQLATFYSETGLITDLNVIAVDEPLVFEPQLNYFDNYQQAFQLNPDYLSRKKQILQENIRLAFAKNQRLPQLDLKASYGLNGLGETPGDAFDQIDDARFAAWTVGLELRIPITGGIREKNELAAARLGKKRALLGLKEIEVQIANALDAALAKVRSHRDNVRSYQSVVEFHEQLLQNQLSALEVGRMDSRTVLETEERLFEAKVAVVESLVFFQKALLELELVTGSTLQVRGLDLTKPDLQTRTEKLLASTKWSESVLHRYAREAEREYDLRRLGPDSLTHREAIDYLRQTTHEPVDWQRQPSIEPEVAHEALDLLRSQRPPAPQQAAPGDQEAALQVLREHMRTSPSAPQ